MNANQLWTRRSARLLGLALLSATGALAQTRDAFDPAAVAEARPWARGVSEADQQAARQFFREGNEARRDSLFTRAALKYREALALWRHPAIHFSLAQVLLALDQPVEVHEQLGAALRFGAVPLDADRYELALRQQEQVERTLAKVMLSCEVPGAGVTIDGLPVFEAPGRHEAVLRAGRHTFAASRAGFLSVELPKVLSGGDVLRLRLELSRAEELTQYRRLWPVWAPWTVAASGAGLLGLGVGLQFAARSAYVRYDDGIIACAQLGSGGCVPSIPLNRTRQAGDALHAGAIASAAVGGGALVAGLVAAYLNRPRPYTATSAEAGPALAVVPVLAPDFAGTAALVRF